MRSRRIDRPTPVIARRRWLAYAAAGLLPLLGAPPADAQSAWPAKPVRIVVPFVPGGTTDIVARLVGQKLSELWGQPVVIENRAGAGGNIGADLVAKSPPDGYTLLMASGSIFTVNPYLYKSLPFDAQKDFVPVTMVASGPMLISVHPSVPANTLAQLIELARAKPGSIAFGSAGVGSQVHMAAENFAYAAGIQLQHVPYRGEAAALNDLAGGQIQMMAGNLPAAAGFASQGKIRALAVTGRQRARQLPDVPTAGESGLPGFVNTGWFGFMAPAGTPPEIVRRIQTDTVKVLEATDTKARLFVNGMDPVGSEPRAFAEAIAEESVVWQKVIRERGLTAQ
jgi:tripartite-type tricarboxylate transporter receptor subunit TctC